MKVGTKVRYTARADRKAAGYWMERELDGAIGTFAGTFRETATYVEIEIGGRYYTVEATTVEAI